MTGRNDALMSGRHAIADRGNDLYETPEVGVTSLLRAVDLPHRIWEPACGPGAIARVLRAAGHDVFASDLVDYQWPGQDAAGWDFLMPGFLPPEPVEAIVTNPPYKNAEDFVRLSQKDYTEAPKINGLHFQLPAFPATIRQWVSVGSSNFETQERPE